MTHPTYSLSRWSLADLFPNGSGPEIEAAFSQIDTLVSAFETVRAELGPDLPGDRFNQIVSQLEQIDRLSNRLYGYARLWFSGDTQDQGAQSLLARIDQTMAELGNKLLFFTLWWKDLPEELAARLMDGSGDYRYWLEEMRHFKPYTLSEPEEKILNIKNVTGSNALTLLYEAITNRYTFQMTVDGEEKKLTRGEVMVYARHHDPAVRAAAYQALYRVYGADGPILGQIYQTLARDWRNEQVSLRGFTSPMAVRNLGNDLPDEVVDTLLEVCKRNAVIFQRFFKLKARLLGVERLRRYDVYAPVSESKKKYTYDQAAAAVFDSFEHFDPRFAAMAKSVLDADHLDSEVRPGKQTGAFCLTISPDLTPWVLTNFQGEEDDVFTLAHELGHAVHSLLAAHHSSFTQHACLPLAETASTFGEMTLFDQLLRAETDKDARRDMIFRQVDGAYATIQRQAFFALFERQAHDLIQQGASVDELSAAYMENLKEQFGDSMELSDEFRWEWVSIPHIYSVPFYVYAYAFGQLLVLSLFKQYKVEGEAFKPRYLKILSTGGSRAPVELLAEAGIDIRQESFWQGGFDVVAEMVDQLEAL